MDEVEVDQLLDDAESEFLDLRNADLAEIREYRNDLVKREALRNGGNSPRLRIDLYLSDRLHALLNVLAIRKGVGISGDQIDQ